MGYLPSATAAGTNNTRSGSPSRAKRLSKLVAVHFAALTPKERDNIKNSVPGSTPLARHRTTSAHTPEAAKGSKKK
jgi:hypothetical protein